MQLNVCTKYMRNIRREIVKQNQNKRNSRSNKEKIKRERQKEK